MPEDLKGKEYAEGPEKGELLNEGKTKWIYAVKENPQRVIISYKNAITAFNDPNKTKEFETKGKSSNTTTCAIFEMLQKRGIPVAFEKKLNDTEFLAQKCEMIPVEVIGRRYAMGSYTKRHPEYKKEDKIPHRFDDLVLEFNLKTTKGGLHGKNGEVLVDGLKTDEDDPLIANATDETWDLLHPATELPLGKKIMRAEVITPAQLEEVERLTKEIFSIIEEFWSGLDFKFIDFKIEFGITSDGRVVLADVIDNDSWRLRDADWNEMSKENFREGQDLSGVEEDYQLVAKLLETAKNK